MRASLSDIYAITELSQLGRNRKEWMENKRSFNLSVSYEMREI